MTSLVLHGLGCRVEVACTGSAAQTLAESLHEAWSWCLEPSPTDGLPGTVRDAEPLTVQLDDPADLPVRLMLTTQEITHAFIAAQVGHLLMLHAGAVSHPETGATLVYVAPGGTGKTTLSSRLGTRLRYLTDETVGIDSAGRIYPYPKPLSTRSPDGTGPKEEISPEALGLRRSGAPPHVAAVVLLDREPSMSEGPQFETMTFMDSLFSLIPQTSSLTALPTPLHRLEELIDEGRFQRVRYRHAADIADELTRLIGGMS
ncbi:MAG: hypothetical protein ABIP45_14150 [Knoellia sp.]